MTFDWRHRTISPRRDHLVNDVHVTPILGFVRRFFTSSWVFRHLVAGTAVVLFFYLGWWQWERANAGNTISWGYSLQWPAFGVFVVVLWIREIRAELKDGFVGRRYRVEPEPPLSSPVSVQRATASAATTGDERTDAYNRYLAWQAENPGQPRSQYPG